MWPGRIQDFGAKRVGHSLLDVASGTPPAEPRRQAQLHEHDLGKTQWPRLSRHEQISLECAYVRAPGLWGLIGVLALLVDAIYRLTPYALDLTRRSLDAVEIAALVGWVAFNGYSEGYRAFHRQFSPRVIARARALDANPRPLHVVLAPLFVMGMIHATRKRLIVSWVIAAFIVGIVIVVRMLDQPWRGIIDAGVVIALAWGVASMLYYAARAFAGHPMPVDPDLPSR